MPGRVVVEVTGEVDSYTAPALDACLDSQSTRRGVRELVVDLRRVTFLGAAAVTVLAQAHRRCRLRDARLVVCTGGRADVLRPLQLTGFSDTGVVDPADVEPEPTPAPRTATRTRTRPRKTSTRRSQHVHR